MKPTDIIFKAKRTDNGAWVQGYYFIDLENKNPYIMLSSRKKTIKDWMIKSVQINPKTLCIGFKDETGKCWFAGDKVLFNTFGTIGVIVFSQNGFIIRFDNERFRLVSDCIFEDLTITGNIHD